MVTGLELMALNWWLLVAVCGRQTLVCLTLPLLHIHTLLTPVLDILTNITLLHVFGMNILIIILFHH